MIYEIKKLCVMKPVKQVSLFEPMKLLNANDKMSDEVNSLLKKLLHGQKL